MTLEDQQLLWSILIVSFGIVAPCVGVWHWCNQHQRQRDEAEFARKNHAFNTYALNGVATEAFESLTAAGADAAGRAHAAVVAKRLHGRTRFVALDTCPKCEFLDVHPFRRRDNCPEDRTVVRTCRSCNFEWWES